MNFFERIFNSKKVSLDLDEIQSIILRTRPAPYYGTIGIFKIRDAAKGKALLKELIPMVNSAEDWHKGEGATLTLAFTYEGLKNLGLPQASLDSFPEAFREGMSARAAQLYDVGVNDPKNWEDIFRSGHVDVAAAVVAATKEGWQEKLSQLRQQIEKLDATETIYYHDFGADEKVKNVFGFRDGISNPEVEGSGIDVPDGFDKPIKPGEFILGYPGESGVIKPFPQPDILGKNGSFLIFRKYQSQVAAFNQFISDHTATPEEGELLAAKMVGRWRSGAPLVLSPEKDDKVLGGNEDKNNDFSYKDDDHGKKCPFGAHIRRMNPRDTRGVILEDVRLHRIIRKSVTFGDIVPPDVTKDDGKERGQYFIGISANAMGTLEFLQKQWANDGNSQNLGEEKDPMIGVQEDGLFSQPGEPIVQRYRGLQTFNIVKGGEYCFLPSLSALKWMSEL